MSVNDAGKELSDHPGRVTAFLVFLGAPPDDPRRGEGTLYSSHDFGEAPKKVFALNSSLVSVELVELQQGTEERPQNMPPQREESGYSLTQKYK